MTLNLKNFLTQDMIRLKIDVPDHIAALRAGAQLLVDHGGVEPQYIDAILECLREFGPYVVIAPGLALGHARPDASVHFTCFSLITLTRPVVFGVPDNDPVDVIFSFAAPDKQGHIEALRQMANLCSDEENMQKIRSATRAEEILALL